MNPTRGRKVAIAAGVGVLALMAVLPWVFWDHILFLQEFDSLGRNPRGYREYRHEETGIIFVSLPGGTFLMGSPEDEEGHQGHEGPVHEVTLSPFMIAKYEVTQRQWEAVMGVGSNPSVYKGDSQPVEAVSWDDCQEFCKKVGLFLPTEAQWEYACRAGTTSPYAGSGDLDDMGWYRDNSDTGNGFKTHPVGEKQANQFGIHDMHGNVFEWCEDVYDGTFYSKDVPGFDPLSLAGSEARVERGGGWSGSARLSRSARRSGSPPAWRSDRLGLRPAFPSP